MRIAVPPIPLRSVLFAAAVVLLAPAPGAASRAADIEAIHFLVPGSAGGGWDRTARGVGEALTGAGLVGTASYQNMSGGIGGRAIAHLIETAKSRDATLLVTSTPTIIRSLQKVFPQSFRDMTPIAAVVADYGAFVVPADSPLKSWDDVLAAYKANGDTVKVAGGSVRGSLAHLVAAMAFQAAGEKPSDVRYIAYDADGKALAGLLSGEADMLSAGLGDVLSPYKEGQVRILAVTSDERLDDAPDVPTLRELGYDMTFANWRGFFAAPGLSDEKADAYAEVIGDMYKTPEWEEVRARYGWINLYKPRAEFTAFLEGQEKSLGDLMRQLGVLE